MTRARRLPLLRLVDGRRFLVALSEAATPVRRRRFPKVSAGDTRSAAFRTIARTLWLKCSASTLMPSTYRALERHWEE